MLAVLSKYLMWFTKDKLFAVVWFIEFIQRYIFAKTKL